MNPFRMHSPQNLRSQSASDNLDHRSSRRRYQSLPKEWRPMPLEEQEQPEDPIEKQYPSPPEEPDPTDPPHQHPIVQGGQVNIAERVDFNASRLVTVQELNRQERLRQSILISNCSPSDDEARNRVRANDIVLRRTASKERRRRYTANIQDLNRSINPRELLVRGDPLLKHSQYLGPMWDTSGRWPGQPGYGYSPVDGTPLGSDYILYVRHQKASFVSVEEEIDGRVAEAAAIVHRDITVDARKSSSSGKASRKSPKRKRAKAVAALRTNGRGRAS